MTTSDTQSHAEATIPSLSYTVLIGATGGIGQEIAKQLCLNNNPVILVGRNTQTLADLQHKLSQEYSKLAIESYACDLSLPASQDDLVNALTQFTSGSNKANSGTIDTVILNAGINDFALLTDQSDQLLEQMMLVNVSYPLQLIKRLLPVLIKQGQPSQIITIGSTFGSIGYPGYSAYSASKFALRGATEALSREYADTNIRFRYFAPRATKTTMNSDAVMSMNQELKVGMDSPDIVAAALVKFIKGQQASQHIGFPERFFAWLNRVFPSSVGSAIVKDLPTIKRYAKK